LGQVDWQAIAAALKEIGYTAGMVIEHEDPLYEGERFEEGLCLGLEFLRNLFYSG
jgi:sugar phosphate isomerase/epimerase